MPAGGPIIVSGRPTSGAPSTGFGRTPSSPAYHLTSSGGGAHGAMSVKVNGKRVPLMSLCKPKAEVDK